MTIRKPKFSFSKSTSIAVNFSLEILVFFFIDLWLPIFMPQLLSEVREGVLIIISKRITVVVLLKTCAEILRIFRANF